MTTPVRSWRRRFVDAVKDRFFVRFHMALILVAVTLVGMIANKLLFLAGLSEMWARYPAAVVLAYGSFFLFVWLWIGYVHASTPRSLTEPLLVAGGAAAGAAAVGGPRRAPREGPSASEVLDAGDGLDLAEGTVDGLGDAAGSADEGAVVVLFIVLVLAIVFAGGWLVWQAPAILSEAAFSAALAGAVRRAAKDQDGPSWAWHVLRKSIAAFGVVALVAAGVGYGTRVVCPQASTLRGALHCDPAMAETLADR